MVVRFPNGPELTPGRPGLDPGLELLLELLLFDWLESLVEDWDEAPPDADELPDKPAPCSGPPRK
jgi:hypothetical protein